MNMQKIANKVICFLSPMKFAAWLVLILAFFTKLSNPFYHFEGGPNSIPPTPLPEAIFKTFFIFCAMFVLLGNGKTVKLRLSLLMIPFYYLTIVFVHKFWQTNTQSLLLPMIILGILTVWIGIAGEYYESNHGKCPDFVDSYVDWLAAKFNFKSYRQD